MALTAGSRFGSYEIVSAIGAGGMGEVYRARDPRLKRDVAIKVLPEAFAQDADRLARFQREAEVLATLNHPNIAAVYGFEEAATARGIVLELVDGPTLADRIAAGPVPLGEALAIARQIADALEAAHDKGIVHRDLKPANVKLTPDGKVKVLDFGLAKLAETETSSSSLSLSPTLSVHATHGGVILGTAAYMSPEQARAKTVDRRTDVWAFGCVLFEMLAGQQSFGGDNLTDVLARVIERAPDWSAVPATTPAHVRRVLRRCLEKDAGRRMHHLADVRIALEEPDDPGPVVLPANARAAWSRWLPLLAAVLVLAIAIVVATRPAPESRDRAVLHLDLPSPPNVEVLTGFSQSFALSPDASTTAFVGVRDGVRRVFLKSLTQPDLREVPGTSGANSVTFSPDGTQLAFVGGAATLSTFALGDSAIKSLAAGADANAGLAWGELGITFTRESALWFVSTTGGTPRRLTTLDASRGEMAHTSPIFLRGGRVVLFSSLTNQPGTERLETVPVEGDARRTVVMDRARRAAWVPTGHLLFDRDGAVMVATFDPDSLTTGPATIAMPAGEVAPNSFGGLGFQVTASGALVYVPAAHGHRSIVMVNRDGSSLPLDAATGRYTNPRLSPDGRRLAVDVNLSSESVIDLVRGTMVTLQQPAFGSGFITWNSDGSRLVFRRFNQPFSMAADGRGDGAPVPRSGANDYPSSAGPDADSILAVRIGPETSGDIYLFSISGKFEPRPLVAARGYQGGPQLSPDRRWLLYQSDESGEAEIYVRAYPALDRAWQVSVGGGVQARWSRGGREIAYRAGNPMMSVAFDGAGAAPGLGKPQPLFAQAFDYGQGISIANYDVGADGRFVMLRPEHSVPPLHVILNWTEELRRKLATR